MAISCKKQYEHIRHLPSDKSFELETDTEVGSFFLTTTKEVNLSLCVNDIDYFQIGSKLNQFYNIQSLNIDTDKPVSMSVARRLLNCFPSFFSALLWLIVKSDSIESFELALQTCNRKDIALKKMQELSKNYVENVLLPQLEKLREEWWLAQTNNEQADEMVLLL